MPTGRVNIALDDPALDPTPVWTRIDDTFNLVAGIDIRRGRQTEFDVTDVSTATVYINDTAGLFDPNNSSSPYFGKLDGKQITLQLWNPVTSAWVPQYRGFVDDYGFTFNPATNISGEPLIANVAIQCVDLMAYLAGVEMLPGTFGDLPSDGTVTYSEDDFKARIEALLTDAGVDSAFFSIFTGNVDVQETRYDPGDSLLVAIRDALDAEFPGIANGYTDKLGRFVAHGRFARFTPDTVKIGSDWAFARYPAGDGTAIVADPTRAQIRPPLQWSRPRSRIINSAIAYPRGMAEADMAGQIVVDTASRDEFGYRSWSAPDLITAAGTTTGYDANTETRLFAEYYVENYKDPQTRVEALTFRAIRPGDARATATWNLICNIDVSDIVDLEHGYPGGVGISEEFYVEGSEMRIRPLNPTHDMVELSLNVTPATYYSEDVFTT